MEANLNPFFLVARASATETADLVFIPCQIEPKPIRWYSQLPCLTFSIKRESAKRLSCVVDRWQLDTTTSKVSSYCFVGEATCK